MSYEERILLYFKETSQEISDICTLQWQRLLQDDHMLRALASLIWKSL